MKNRVRGEHSESGYLADSLLACIVLQFRELARIRTSRVEQSDRSSVGALIQQGAFRDEEERPRCHVNEKKVKLGDAKVGKP